MIDEDKKARDRKAENVRLAHKADENAREALHFLSEQHPEEFTTICALAEQHPNWLRRLMRAQYISGWNNGQDALRSEQKAIEDAKNKTLN